MSKKILVTGANGFVGRNLVDYLRLQGNEVVCAVRGDASRRFDLDGVVEVGDINERTDWRVALDGVDAVVHCAARVHIPKDGSSSSSYHLVNCAGSENLAEQAASAGVARLVFVSSIKVNGDYNDQRPFTRSDMPSPTDAYGISKLNAELALWKVAKRTNLEVVVVRPPLVYGPGVSANFRRLIGLAYSRIPLPFNSVSNLRSLVYIGNLVDLLSVCVVHPKAIGKLYLVSDGVDVGLAELIREICSFLPRHGRLLSVDPRIINLLLRAIGKQGASERLLKSLQVDISETKAELGWLPPFSQRAAIKLTVDDFCTNIGKR